MANVTDKVIQILREKSGFTGKINTRTNLYELDLDSLDKVEIVMALEEEFGIVIQEEEFQNAYTIRDVIEIINRSIEECNYDEDDVCNEMAQPEIDDIAEKFSRDWDNLFNDMEELLKSRKHVEHKFQYYWSVAESQHDNDNAASYYYYMASLLCYLFYGAEQTSEESKDWAVKKGTQAIKLAIRKKDDEEFRVLREIFEMVAEEKSHNDVKKSFNKVQEIAKKCPDIESIPDTLIKNEALREWWNEAYYDFLSSKLWSQEVDEDHVLAVELSNALKSSSNERLQFAALAKLADSYYGVQNYPEAARYANLAKDHIEMQDYKQGDFFCWMWGRCWTIFAQCQEKMRDSDFAFTLFEKGANMGIPQCMRELARMYENGISEDVDIAKANELRARAEQIESNE